MKWLAGLVIWLILPIAMATSPTASLKPSCVETIGQLTAHGFPTTRLGKRSTAKAQDFDFTKFAQCVNSADAQRTAAMLIELDEDATPRTFKLTTVSAKDAVLPARVRVLDGAFVTLKEYAFERFVRRGTDFGLTVFLDGGEHARYLLVTPDLDWLGRTNHSVAGHRWTTVWTTGVVTGVLSNGYESNVDTPFAIGGTLRVELEDDDRVAGSPQH